MIVIVIRSQLEWDRVHGIRINVVHFLKMGVTYTQASADTKPIRPCPGAVPSCSFPAYCLWPESPGFLIIQELCPLLS